MKLRYYFLLLVVAFAAIGAMGYWGYKQLENVPSPEMFAIEPAVTAPADGPPPTVAPPTCAPGELWSKHASKCYIPKGSDPKRINAVPSAKCD